MRSFSGSLLLTFRELWATRITQGVFVLTTIAWILISLAMNLDVVEGSISALRIFGFESTPQHAVFNPETQEVVRSAVSVDRFFLEINQMVFGAAYFFGTLLGLFATMPLLGGFLQEGRLDLMLSKPVSRPRLLLGQVAGVWLTVLALSVYLLGSIWLVLSIKTGIWSARQLAAIPMILVMFGVMYAFMLAISIRFRSTGLALVVTYGLIFFSLFLALRAQIEPVLGKTALVVYRGFDHILPKFIDGVVLMSQLGKGEVVETWYPFVSSIIIGAVVYGIGFLYFSRRDF